MRGEGADDVRFCHVVSPEVIAGSNMEDVAMYGYILMSRPVDWLVRLALRIRERQVDLVWAGISAAEAKSVRD